MYTALFSVLFLLVGLTMGWVGQIFYNQFMEKVHHDFEDLFTDNPHPEIFMDNGKIYRGDYLTVNFEPGFDPETDWNPENIYIEDDEDWG